MLIERFIADKIEGALKRKYPKLYGYGIGAPRENEVPMTREVPSPFGPLIGVFEDNGKTGYLYLLEAKNRETVAACWLWNRVPAPSLVEALAIVEQGEAPPLPKEITEFTIAPPWKALKSGELQVNWNSDGTAVFVKVKKTVFGAIGLDYGVWKAFPAQVFKPCRWGEPLNKQVLNRYRLG